MSESKLRELSTDFSVRIIRLCETIKGHYSLVNQLERSAASIGEISVKPIMPTVDPILLQNCKSH